jgi:hypothetical protein
MLRDPQLLMVLVGKDLVVLLLGVLLHVLVMVDDRPMLPVLMDTGLHLVLLHLMLLLSLLLLLLFVL